MVCRVSPAATERYVFKDFPHSSHRVLCELVGGEPVRVLDLGAATGFLGRSLAARGHEVVGVEMDSEAAAAATPAYAAFHVLDLACLPRLPEAPFDVVVAGDVIEHLDDPDALLERVAAQLAPAGRLLLSVPNVAFIQVRLGLLAGRFTYAPRGILDRTHLRFFTRRSVLDAVRRAGLRPVSTRGVPPPLPLLWSAFARWPLRVGYELTALLARAWPTLFAFQLIVEARR